MFVAACVALISTPAYASLQIFFLDDFQDNNLNGWVFEGNGFSSAASDRPTPLPSGAPYARVRNEY